MVAQILEDVLGWDLTHVELIEEEWHLVDFVLVGAWVDETLIDCTLNKGRLDVAASAMLIAHLQELHQTWFNEESIIVGVGVAGGDCVIVYV